MARCGFKTDIEYREEKTGEYVQYECHEPEENILDSGLCIFHDENYLKDPKNQVVNEQNLRSKIYEKLAKSEPLICIGYYLRDISFEQIHFDKPVNFSGAVFIGLTNFSKAQFKIVEYSQTQFMGLADFSEAKFAGKSNFSRAQFSNEANFIEAQFSKEANFSRTQFMERADFSGAQFTKEVDFLRAQFTKEVNFMNIQFKERALFSRIQFPEVARFSGAQFTKEADFSQTQFKKEALFSGALFMEKANFAFAQFTKEVDFSSAQFTKEALFSGAEFIEHSPRLNFKNVRIDDQKHFILPINDLSEVSFANTDVSRVKFGVDAVWGDRSKIRDEREIQHQLKNNKVAEGIKLGDILTVYRSLRDNYEYWMRYTEAGEFFIREMEINRLYKQDIKNGQSQIRRNNRVTRNLSLTGLYYHLSRYGQSFSRPALFGIVIVLLSTFLWSMQPNAAGELIFTANVSQIVNSSNLQVAFERSLTNFLPSLSFGTELNVGLLDVAFKIVGGAVTFGLIIIALRRKFERKFRH